MSQIVPSAQVTLKTQHSQLDSPSLDKHWRSPLCERSRDLRKKVISWFQSYELNLLDTMISIEEKKHEWPN